MSEDTPVNGAETATGEPPKTAKQLEKEAIKAAKLAKLAEKNKKKAETPAAPKEKAQVGC